MKKLLLPILSFILIASGCGSTEETETSAGTENTATEEKMNIYTTVYPLTYFTERIGGEHVSVQSIYPAGSNEHTFEPTQKDMIALADADVLFYIGLGLEGFIDSAKKTLSNENVEFIATAESIPEAELGEGHSHEEEAVDEEYDHAHEEGTEGEHDHGHEVDPHVWISPVLSQQLAESIKDELVERDSENAEEYEENYDQLIEELQELDQSFGELAAADQKTFFVSHAAFGYWADAYGLEQVAVAGLNSQDEPSQQELLNIVKQAEELNVESIAFEQNVSSQLTEVIQKEIGAQPVQLHNLSVLTQDEIDAGETYFSLMQKNLEVMEEILR